MEKPFEFIECKIHRCDEFKITDGYQPTYAFFYLKEGSFRLKMDGKETVVQKNDSVIFYDNVNFFRTIITPISFLYLQFRINPRCPFKIHVPLGVVSFRDQHRFLDSIQKYESLLESSDMRAVYYREHLMEDILLQAFAESEHFTEIANNSEQYNLLNCHDTLVLNATAFIKDNLANKLQIADICNHLGTNPSTLNFKFRKELSVSVWNYIMAQRMKKAKQYLTNATYSITDIASRCGFDNVYYFSNAFRKYYGISPNAFRNFYR